ncbi:MAG: hypothetical protein EAZ07_07880 [Cytophagales bacterium]|nr:MAG: hypothetical protein EAZ07_07880 [Cytophagales bacterium]
MGFILLFSILIGIFFLPYLSNSVKPFLRLLINLIVAIPSFIVAFNAVQYGPQNIWIGEFSITGVWELKIDELSAFFIAIINISILASSVYGLGYLKENKNSIALSIKFISSILLHVGLLGVCMLQNFIPFMISWEVMSISSFMLVIFQYHKPNAIKAGLNYLIQMHIGVVLLMVGFIIVGNTTGQSNFDAIGLYFSNHNNNFWLFLVFFIGFSFKIGFLTLHTWMPEAYAVAPSNISGVMSGVVKKMGIYGILRILFYVQNTRLEIGIFILTISLATCLYGIINAIMQTDIKKLLSYSSMENMGIIGIGLGMAMIGFGVHDLALAYLGFTASLLQILNHALFKTSLFFNNGGIYQQTRTRNIDQLGGLSKYMPITSILFLLSSIAACGLPPFNGFVAEYIIYSGLIEGMNATFVTTEVFLLLCLIILSLVGGLAIFTYSKVFGLVFLGNPRSEIITPTKEAPLLMLIPQIILMSIALSIGLYPKFILSYITKIVDVYVPHYSHVSLDSYSDVLELGHAGSIFILIVLVLIIVRKFVLNKKTIEYQVTWGCGYETKNTRMQYNSASWADYFLKFGNFFIGHHNSFTPLKKEDIFPDDKKMKISYFDKIESNLIQPLLELVNYTLNKLAVIQTGQTQYYILYGFVFLLFMSILTFFKIL